MISRLLNVLIYKNLTKKAFEGKKKKKILLISDQDFMENLKNESNQEFTSHLHNRLNPEGENQDHIDYFLLQTSLSPTTFIVILVHCFLQCLSGHTGI